MSPLSSNTIQEPTQLSCCQYQCNSLLLSTPIAQHVLIHWEMTWVFDTAGLCSLRHCIYNPFNSFVIKISFGNCTCPLLVNLNEVWTKKQWTVAICLCHATSVWNYKACLILLEQAFDQQLLYLYMVFVIQKSTLLDLY